MRIFRNETHNTRLEDIWAILDMMEDQVFEQMQDAARKDDRQRFYRLCAQVNLLDRAQEIYKKLRNGKKR